jgi:hypothetical protein
MTLRTTASLAALAIAVGLSGQSLAQTAPTQRPPSAEQTAPKAPVAGQIVAQDADTILASRDFIGQTVYAPDKAKIGSISDLNKTCLEVGDDTQNNSELGCAGDRSRIVRAEFGSDRADAASAER